LLSDWLGGVCCGGVDLDDSLGVDGALGGGELEGGELEGGVLGGVGGGGG
jgi:hypothetical protein